MAIRNHRRTFLKSVLAGSLAGGSVFPLQVFSQSATRILLLGTQGGPNFNLTRGETASLLLVDDVPYLIDCGYGTMAALHDAGINFLTIPDIFLTHLHDDHVADVAALLSHQWTQGRVDATRVHGPYGTDALVAGALAFTAGNADIRFIDEGRSIRPETLFRANVISATDTVNVFFEDDRIRVSSIENSHFPDWAKVQMPYRSLSYRFDTADRSVVFSGDTTYSENLVNLARGADVLVTEVIEPVIMREWFDEVVAGGNYQDSPENIWTHIAETHLTTEDAGRIANAAGVGTLVLNHLLPGALRDVDDDFYLEGIRRNYQGQVVVGRDGLVI
jgi:ribonuclease BN (tRNA processing enzyme)